MARLIIHVESTALLNWDTANQLGTWVTEVRHRQLKKGGCVVWVWGSRVLGALPGAWDKWWQETALGFLPDLTNWTPGKGVREQLHLTEKIIFDTNFVVNFLGASKAVRKTWGIQRLPECKCETPVLWGCLLCKCIVQCIEYLPFKILKCWIVRQ